MPPRSATSDTAATRATNRHPVDELADVRERMRRLKDREDELRKMIASGEVGLVGDQHEASIRSQVSERVDTKAIREKFGDAIKPFLKSTSSVVVKVAPREVLEDVG